jgi:hypothetical protein
MGEDPRPTSTAPGHVAVAVVHEDPPRVLIASDESALSRAVALQIVCEADPYGLPIGSVERIRDALLEEDWASAVAVWIEVTGVRVDVHPDEPVLHPHDFGPEGVAFDIRLSRLFES